MFVLAIVCLAFQKVSDKLQDGVQDVITYARNCGIKVVMATGDAFETAEAIWRKLGQVHVHPTDASVDKLERFVALDFTDPITKEVTRERVIAALARFEKIKLTEKCVLIVDGTMLTHLKSTSSIKDLRGRFCAAMDNFDSVVAARVTADQKGEINDIYQYNGNVTLAIGDGGNDITMIQKATVSVGLRSAETDSAARAADFKIQEFRHLQGLLIYGLHNYFRLSTVYLWNDYKAILLALVPFIARFVPWLQPSCVKMPRWF
jgi:magnesium-transporting ATPase (P-type)